MDWTADGATTLLVIVRAIHFAATAITAGTLLAGIVVAEPALRRSGAAARAVASQNLRVAWTGLAVAILSGIGWVALQAHAMSGLPWTEALAPGNLQTVLTETRFGLATVTRYVLAILVGCGLVRGRNYGPRWPAAALALGLLATLAWTGHAGAEAASTAELHVAADALHLLAAGAWIGGLVPLVMTLRASHDVAAETGAEIACDAATRFSTLGVISVATLIVTGLVNAWILVGVPRGLVATEYGRLLLVKLALFAVMLLLAAVNRQVLRPKLAATAADGPRRAAFRLLTLNSVVEIAFGLAIFTVVGALGITHPAVHFAPELLGGPD
ncbi:MAG: copper homeostasis membrane protein CopD [Pseudomonadota bacterium]